MLRIRVKRTAKQLTKDMGNDKYKYIDGWYWYYCDFYNSNLRLFMHTCG